MTSFTCLSDAYLALIQKLYKHSPVNLLSNLEMPFIYLIEKSTDIYIRDKSDTIKAAILDIEQSDEINKSKLEIIFESYNEALFYMFLKSKLPTEHIKTGKTKAPDFKVNLYNKDYYFEYKALKMLGGQYKYSIIEKEYKELQKKPHITHYDNATITMTEQFIQPHHKCRDGYDPFSMKMVIENIIDKASQNIKEGQFQHGQTILALDLTSELPTFGHISHEIKKEYPGRFGEAVSGALYHAATGKTGDKILCHAEFQGKQKTETLEKQGILRDFPFIKAILFHKSTFGKSEGYCAMYQAMTAKDFDQTLIDLLEYISLSRCVSSS